MIIIFQNNEIIGIDKKLLSFLNITLENLSSFLKEIELELKSLLNEEIIINNQSFNVKKADILSPFDIKIFDLSPKEKQEINMTEATIDLSNDLKPLNLELSEPFTIDLQKENQNSTLENSNLDLTKDNINLNENIELKKIKSDTNLINENITKENNLNIEKVDIPNIDTLNNISLQSTKNNLDIETSNYNLNHEPSNLTNNEDLLQSYIETEKQDLSINNEENTSSLNNIISLNFEDEFSEIEKMLNQSKEEASKNLEKELETAAKELEIDIDTIYDLKNELFEMLKQEKSNFFKALKTKNYIQLHKIAHKLKGAALNLRLSNLAYILKQIDEFSKSKKDLHKIEYLINKFYEYLDKLSVNKPKNKIPKEIKSLILNTIEDYLTTQNEKKFKKDLKYIEKILNKKINSLEELEEIIKE